MTQYIKQIATILFLLLLFCSAKINAQATFIGPTTVDANTQATYRISEPVQLNGQIYVIGGTVIGQTQVAPDIYDITIQWNSPSNGLGYVEANVNVANYGQQIIHLDVDIRVSLDFEIQGPTLVNQYSSTKYDIDKETTGNISNWYIEGGEIIDISEGSLLVLWTENTSGVIRYTLGEITKTLPVTINDPIPNSSPYEITGPDIVEPNSPVLYHMDGVSGDVRVQYHVVGGNLSSIEREEAAFYPEWPDVPYASEGVIIATIYLDANTWYTTYKEVTINVTPPFIKLTGENTVAVNQRENYFVESNLPDFLLNWNVQGGVILDETATTVFVDWSEKTTAVVTATVRAPNGDVFTDQISVSVDLANLGIPHILGPIVAKQGEVVKYEIKDIYDQETTYTNVQWDVVGGQITESNEFGAIVHWDHLIDGEHNITVSGKDVDGIVKSSTTEVTLMSYNLNTYGSSPSSISVDENYVHTRTFDEPIQSLSQATEFNTIENIKYFDALGRPKQEVAIRGGGDKEDIITHMEYDLLGRQSKSYLPYASTTSEKAFRIYGKEDAQSFYNTSKYENTQNFYTETVFEGSPLNRQQKQFAPGEDWKSTQLNDHSVRFVTDVVRNTDEIKEFGVVYDLNKTPSLQYYGVITTGRTGVQKMNNVPLQKVITKSENWQSGDGKDNTIQEFKDYQGRVVLKRLFNNQEAHDTYYVYDNHGSLVYVIPPKASDAIIHTNGSISTTVLDKLCYQYKYDSRYRMIEKKVPGKDWEYMVYDPLDRIVLTQDGRQRSLATKQWLFTKFDIFGRVAYTGMVTSNYNRETIQAYYDDNPGLFTQYETKTTTPQTIAGTTIHYKSEARPLQVDEIHVINYYDTYSFDLEGATNPGTVYGTDVTGNVKTLPTGTKVRVLGTDKWITTVNYYDEKARLIYVYTYNEYLGTTNTVSNQLDFTGKVLESTTTHQRNGDAMITTVDKFTYDHMGRLLTHIQTINDQEAELLASNTYDELGVLVKKVVGGVAVTEILDRYTDVINISVSDSGEITKTSTGNAWQAGLCTNGSIAGDGAVSFIPMQTNKALMVGLSYTNTNVNYNSIGYALYATAAGKLGVYEQGRNKGTFGNYTTSDVLSVVRIGNLVYYQKNGDTFYTSTVASTGTMIGDASFYTHNAKIRAFKITGDTSEELVNTGLQTIDYTYNVRGWLKQINNPHEALGDDLFAFGINYNEPTNSTQALYNGNISQTFWKTANDGIKRRYDYAYDALNRITAGVHISGKYNLTNVKYDKNGNILNLTRTGWQNGVSYANMDRLTYQYDAGNQLTKVIDTGNDQYGFIDGTNTNEDYVYDINGNMTVDRNKGITNITYNHLNLPTQVTINGKQIKYVYDATGVKQSKSFDDTFTLYDNGYIYENGELQFFGQPEGYVEANASGDFDYVYQFKDQVDNIRLSYSDTNKDGMITQEEILEENNYYPFGLKHKGYNNVVNGRDHKYGFGGKEEQDENGLAWIDITARNYDPALGRWMNLDPLAELMRRHSPYNYGFDNPVFFIDPDGMAPSGWLSFPGAVDMRGQYEPGFKDTYDSNSGEYLNNEQNYVDREINKSIRIEVKVFDSNDIDNELEVHVSYIINIKQTMDEYGNIKTVIASSSKDNIRIMYNKQGYGVHAGFRVANDKGDFYLDLDLFQGEEKVTSAINFGVSVGEKDISNAALSYEYGTERNVPGGAVRLSYSYSALLDNNGNLVDGIDPNSNTYNGNPEENLNNLDILKKKSFFYRSNYSIHVYPAVQLKGRSFRR